MSERYMTIDSFDLCKVMNADVQELIEKYGLDSNSRKEHITYKRYYLYDFMYNKRHLTLSMIGQFFNRHHSTVLHGINEHKYWWGKRDERYIKYVHPIPNLITAKRTDPDMFDVNIIPVCDEDMTVTITGNFPRKLLTKYQEKMTASEIVSIFEGIIFKVNIGEGEQ